MRFSRYAIYHTPPPGPFATFGAAWLGWDLAEGVVRARPRIEGLPRDAAELVETPRRYGLHATLKPPFRLAAGVGVDDLAMAVEALAATRTPVAVEGLRLARMSGFVALTAVGDTGALDALAARAVTDLDRFRAPPTEAELARRRSGGLSEVEEEALRAWGYPYVLDAFRFHISLTGRLPEREAEAVSAALAPHLDPVLERPYPIADLTLAGEGEDGMFRQVHRYTLSG